jgi:hypothetical protein
LLCVCFPPCQPTFPPRHPHALHRATMPPRHHATHMICSAPPRHHAIMPLTRFAPRHRATPPPRHHASRATTATTNGPRDSSGAGEKRVVHFSCISCTFVHFVCVLYVLRVLYVGVVCVCARHPRTCYRAFLLGLLCVCGCKRATYVWLLMRCSLCMVAYA